MGNTVVQKVRQFRKFKFMLLRKIFLSKFNYRGDDPFLAHDVPAGQGRACITCHLGRAPGGDEHGSGLWSRHTCNDGRGHGGGQRGGLRASGLERLQETRAVGGPVAQHRDTLAYVEPDDLQEQFLQVVQKSPDYGSQWFYAHKLESQMRASPRPSSSCRTTSCYLQRRGHAHLQLLETQSAELPLLGHLQVGHYFILVSLH
jgi:hypothetical protein